MKKVGSEIDSAIFGDWNYPNSDFVRKNNLGMKMILKALGSNYPNLNWIRKRWER